MISFFLFCLSSSPLQFGLYCHLLLLPLPSSLPTSALSFFFYFAYFNGTDLLQQRNLGVLGCEGREEVGERESNDRHVRWILKKGIASSWVRLLHHPVVRYVCIFADAQAQKLQSFFCCVGVQHTLLHVRYDFFPVLGGGCSPTRQPSLMLPPLNGSLFHDHSPLSLFLPWNIARRSQPQSTPRQKEDGGAGR